MARAKPGHGLAWIRALVTATPWPDECAEFPGRRDKDGYGALRHGPHQVTHRIAYELAYGSIPDGLQVLHKCIRTRACCNPAHLYAGTPTDNTADMVRDGTAARGERHGSVTHPERVPRGDANGSRLHPERLNPPRGDNHHSRLRPQGIPRGDKHGMAKLTDEKVREIRRRGNEKHQVLATEYGVSRRMIGNIIQRRNWAHVLDDA